MMDQLIQTAESNIIFGRFRGEDNKELFRCPRQNMEDLRRYINEYRSLVAPMGSDKMPFVDDYVEDLRNIEGKEMIAYWRMYFRNGWAGRWLFESKNGPDRLDCIGVDNIVDWFCKRFKNGCNWEMKGFFESKFALWGGKERYLIKPFMSDYYKVMVDTTYGNDDYPVRIYVYRDKKGE